MVCLVGAARRAAQAAPAFIHLAVYTPYAAMDIPGPAVLTYGFRAPSLRALSTALLHPSACSGRLPIDLPTLPSA